MIVAASAFHAARMKVAVGALLVFTATSAHAVAKNHDVQQIRIPSSPTTGHDRALGPSMHGEN